MSPFMLFLLCLLPLVSSQCQSSSCSGCLRQMGCFWGANSCSQDCPYGFICPKQCPNLCDPDPCQNGGRCNQNDGICTCGPGWGAWDCSVRTGLCGSDADCTAGYCSEGVCRPSTELNVPCTQWGNECAAGLTCVLQNSRGGVCQRRNECTRNDQCEPFHERCVNRRCEDVSQLPAACTRSEECFGGTSYPPLMTCENRQCVYASTPYGVCRADYDCASDNVCSAGRCWSNLPSCRWDADCAFFEQCRSASCVDTRGLQCSSRADCAPGLCVQGLCQSPSCSSNAQCSAGSVCVSGRCIAAQVCRNDGDCSLGERCAASRRNTRQLLAQPFNNDLNVNVNDVNSVANVDNNSVQNFTKPVVAEKVDMQTIKMSEETRAENLRGSQRQVLQIPLGADGRIDGISRPTRRRPYNNNYNDYNNNHASNNFVNINNNFINNYFDNSNNFNNNNNYNNNFNNYNNNDNSYNNRYDDLTCRCAASYCSPRTEWDYPRTPQPTPRPYPLFPPTPRPYQPRPTPRYFPPSRRPQGKRPTHFLG